MKKYIGISYERFAKKFNDSTILQSSIGRLCGYNDNGDSICYTNITSCENYIKLWENDLSYEGIEWNTSTTKYDKYEKCTKSKEKSFNHAKNIDGIDIYEEVNTLYTNKEYKYEKLDGTKETLREWWNSNFTGKGKSRFKLTNRSRQNKDGKYVFDGGVILSENEVEEDIRNDRLMKYMGHQGQQQRDGRNIIPYYTNQEELKWILIYRETI